ncbi:Saccharopine dehydrogenase [Orbilia oligospora]|uniref:Saccharopine dehydrogenase [NAD(+), L-lysine-forming] n=1 Tax=Orbilia oligospora TaxID=2813651 RepID=A0A7C8R6L5_ORBOL|nr:Saccharopine dehydrogenase [Orbilia oligospora]
MATVLHLRAETKPLEHRSCLTPTTAKALVDAGYDVRVERSPQSIFDDKEFEDAGIPLVETGSWVNAPKDHLIVGLKELPEENFPLIHEHIQFAHVFKQQTGYRETLGRYQNCLYDLEFLNDDNGRRVAAFGYYAGFAGAALALEIWAWNVTHPDGPGYPPVKPYPNEAALISHVKESIEKAKAVNGGAEPRVIVIGALGRCGSGSVDLCTKVGLGEESILKWDMAETKPGGPFKEITQSDIFINCIYLMGKIPPFVTKEAINTDENRKLRLICDVACDPNSPFNPVPVYEIWTTFDAPTVDVTGIESGPPVSVISIDHLPTLLPRESSESFSAQLLPSLLQLKDRETSRVWADAKKLFDQKKAELDQ